MRMAQASGSIASSFSKQFPQLLADQYLASREAKPARSRTLEAYVAKMKLAKAQAHSATNTTTGNITERTATNMMGQPWVEPMRRQQTAADENSAIQPQSNTARRPTPPEPPKAGPKAIAIVAPTPQWEAVRQARQPKSKHCCEHGWKGLVIVFHVVGYEQTDRSGARDQGRGLDRNGKKVESCNCFLSS